MEEKRVKLFGDILTFAAKKKEVFKFEKKYPNGYPDWKSINFENESTVKRLHGDVTNMGIFNPPFTEKSFFEKFACDLTWAKTLNYCGGNSSATNTGGIFDCLIKDTDLKLSADKKTVTYEGTKDHGTKVKWTFYTNNRVSINGNMGSWSCDGADGYSIKLDDGSDEFSSKTGWKSRQTNDNTNTHTNTASFINTNLTGDDLKAGKVVKHGMKGDIVGKIQQLLIDKGFKNISMNKTPDNVFGNRTRRMVKAFQALNNLVDDGVVGKLTWNKLNDASAISASGSTSADPNKPTEIPGADGVVYESLRKKILRKHLLSFK